MNILDHELVRKYFICPLPDNVLESPIRRCVCFADHVLQAMQEPIRKGDRLLYSDDSCGGDMKEDIAFGNYPLWWGIRGIILRLPDRYQKQKKEWKCLCACHDYESIGHMPGCYGGCNDLGAKDYGSREVRDEVEEKIQRIMSGTLDGRKLLDIDMMRRYGTGLEEEIRELVALARKEKQNG